MLVVVLAVSCVPAPVVHIVDVIAVRDGHMAAPLPVNMVVTLMYRVAAGGLAFVVVIVVPSMKMTVVHIVDVITVRDCDMPAPFAMDVVMVDMFVVRCTGHGFLAAVPIGIRPNLRPGARLIPRRQRRDIGCHAGVPRASSARLPAVTCGVQPGRDVS